MDDRHFSWRSYFETFRETVVDDVPPAVFALVASIIAAITTAALLLS